MLSGGYLLGLYSLSLVNFSHNSPLKRNGKILEEPTQNKTVCGEPCLLASSTLALAFSRHRVARPCRWLSPRPRAEERPVVLPPLTGTARHSGPSFAFPAEQLRVCTSGSRRQGAALAVLACQTAQLCRRACLGKAHRQRVPLPSRPPFQQP